MTIRHFNIFKDTSTFRTYSTYAKAVKRAEEADHFRADNLRYVIGATEDGRFYPIFIGAETMELVHDGFAVAS